jgi:hypothetical protein
MRFLALLRKELRESLPWLLLAGLLLLAVGAFALRAQSRFSNPSAWSYNQGMAPGEAVDTYRFLRPSRLELPAVWLAFIATGLGLVLGICHFWAPLFARTWSFLLHRSASRLTVLAAKFSVAVLGFLVSLGFVWTVLYWYACRTNLFPVPEPFKTLVGGWLFVVMGLVVYLGTALSALSTARWYTSRIFALAFAILAVLVIWSQWHPAWIVALTVAAISILLVQTVATFLSREF